MASFFVYMLVSFAKLSDLVQGSDEKVMGEVFRRGILGLEPSEQKRIFVYLGWLKHETIEPDLEPLSGRIHSYSSGNIELTIITVL